MARVISRKDFLLGAAGSALFLGSGCGTKLYPPPRTPWKRTTEPLLSATEPWEGTSLQEPTVLYEHGQWTMFYTGAFSDQGLGGPAMGFATCTGDPTITANWKKHPGNPVLGQGTVTPGFVAGNNVLKVDGSYRAFYYDESGGGNLMTCTSLDRINWTRPTVAIPHDAVGWMSGWANSFAWIESDGWKMLVEGAATGGAAPWILVFATSPDGARWRVEGDGPLESLAVPGYNQYSGPWLADGGQRDHFGRLRLWYHVTRTGAIHSDIWYAHSTDGRTWKPAGQGQLYDTGGHYERQQAADPCVIDAAQVGGARSFLFYDGVDNSTLHSYINVATYRGTLNQLLQGHATSPGRSPR